MSAKFSRSTSFFIVDAGQSLDELLQTTRRNKTKYVVVNVDRGRDYPSFYLAEHKRFVSTLEQLNTQLRELKLASELVERLCGPAGQSRHALPISR